MIDISEISSEQDIKIIIGASSQDYDGWIKTQQSELNLLKREDWDKSFKDRKISAILMEHVWEHLSESEALIASKICYDYLKVGGYIRLAVPDGYFRNEAYQKMAQVGGPGPKDHPAATHKVLYNYNNISKPFTFNGFTIKLLEYCDEKGVFHYNYWDEKLGFIYRSKRFDHRNKKGKLGNVSLIIDAIKKN